MSASQVLTAGQMQSAEQALMNAGDTVIDLMERAGAGAAEWVWRIGAGRPVTVLCGPGNNGGDGYVIARLLAERGVTVKVVAPLEPATDAARSACAAWGGSPVEMASGHVLVDCLFGTGLSRSLSNDLAQLLRGLAASHDKAIAIDLPSGVASDTGSLLNDDLPEYDATVALGAWKYAHWLMPSSAHCGERRLVDIGIGRVDGAASLAGRPALGAPARTAHKYSRGMAVVVGGAMPGAAIMAARAAQHGGAGYVKLASEHSHPGLPVDIVHDERGLRDVLADERIGAVLVGPGLGRDAQAGNALEAALALDCSIVLDADALRLLCSDHYLGQAGRILGTPHEGELAALCDAFGIEAEGKLDRAKALNSATGMAILAKGPDTVLVGGDGEVTLFPPQSPWLSTAGTGDVLAGLAVSRMACGDSIADAARTAVAIHAEAASIAPPPFSATGLITMITAAYGSFL